MAITIRDLIGNSDLGLEVAAGASGLDRPIRWVHTSELEDPTPWLRGGELLLTTGMRLQASPALQRAYIGRLVEADLSGLGFGIGFGFSTPPAALLKAADRVGFPVVVVPYPVPFLAIAEAVSSHISDERIREAQMSTEIHERLAALVTEGAGPADVLDDVADLTGGWALLFDLRGAIVARAEAPGAHAPDPGGVWRGLPRGLTERRGAITSSEMGPQGSLIALAVMSGRRHEGVLVFGKGGRLEARDRFAVRHAVTVVGLLLASRRAVVEAERRVAGDILSEAFSGRLNGSELERRLELVGFPAGAPLTALVVEADSETAPDSLEDLAWALDLSLGTRARIARTSIIGDRVGGLVAHDDPEKLAEAVIDEIAEGTRLPGLRIGVGETTPHDAVRHSYLCATLALRAAAPERRVASPRDLGSYGLLLGAQPRPVLEGFVRSILGPLMDRDRAKASDLVPSVRAFIEAGGRWEPGAHALGVHRHTLRYRVRQAEELLGRDLSSAEDRLELWLALKTADLLAE